MRMRMHDHGLINDKVEKIVQHETELLDLRLKEIDPELKLLDVTLLHHLRTDTIDAKLVLHVLDREIAAHGHAERSGQALRQAFDNLEDQLDEFLARLRGEPEIRDEQRRPAWLGQPGVPKTPKQ